MAERLEDRLKQAAHTHGFSLAGIAPATEADHFHRYQHWLTQGYHGEMHYLERRAPERRHPASILASVRSVLMVGLEYAPTGVTHSPLLQSGRVARYAQGSDYHRFMWDRLNMLAAWLKEQVPGTEAVGVTDTAPLLERDFARRAGLGWIGKNTLLIHKGRGSYLFLGALLTSLELEPDPPHLNNHCGTCTACLQACPTGAFPAPGVLDARRCISYLTIEHRSAIPLELREPIGDWIFGCDICQEVCPWNRKPRSGWESAFPHDASLESLDARAITGMTEQEYRERFRHTAISRAKRNGLRRNALIVLGNTGTPECLDVVVAACADNDPVIRETAEWAREQIQRRHSK